MADEHINGAGESQDLPQIEHEDGHGAAPGYRNTPGLSNLMFQPGGQNRGWWDPIEKAMMGSTSPEHFLRLTHVEAHEVGQHMRLQFSSNVARYGNGRANDCIWSGYNLRCSVDAELLGLVRDMVTGSRQQQAKDWREQRRQIADRANGNGQLANSSGRELAG